MSNEIREYYMQVAVMPLLINNKIAKLVRNEDIKNEFEYWIKNQMYKKDDCISVEGYTAENIAALSPFLDGEGAFMLLVELREHPAKAKQRLKDGFVMK